MKVVVVGVRIAMMVYLIYIIIIYCLRAKNITIRFLYCSRAGYQQVLLWKHCIEQSFCCCWCWRSSNVSFWSFEFNFYFDLFSLLQNFHNYVYINYNAHYRWKNMKNPFRLDRSTHLSVIPTLINWKEKEKRLEGDQLCKPELLEIYLEDE